jgi:hypothetical protein
MRATLIGIVLAVAIAGGAIAYLRTRSEEVSRTSEQATQVAELERKLRDAEAEQAQTQAALAKAEERNAELEIEVKKSRETSTPAAQEPPEAPADDEPEEDAERHKQSLDEIREVLRDDAGASAQFKALAELMYADLLNNLDIDPDTKAELRRLLTESLLEITALSRFAILEGDIPWSEVRSWELDEREYLDAKVKELLPAEDYETWSDYFADIDAQQLEGNLRNQIGAVASGLTPENFDLVMQVAVEEFRAQQIALEHSSEMFTLSENMEYQLRAMTAMRQRLSTMLAADQLAEIENWLTMAERLIAAQIPGDDDAD